MGKRVELEACFKVAYIPLPPEMEEARRASLMMLLEWVREDMAETDPYPASPKWKCAIWGKRDETDGWTGAVNKE